LKADLGVGADAVARLGVMGQLIFERLTTLNLMMYSVRQI
jgi:hypothetical protein